MRRAVALSCAALLGASFVAFFHGCSADSGSSPAQEDAGKNDAKPDTREASTALPGFDGSPSDEPDEEGYRVFHEYGYCGLRAPVSRDVLPPPIRWEPCPQVGSMAGLACRQMASDWMPAKIDPIGPTSFFTTEQAWGHDGVVTMMLTRSSDKHVLRIIADADGPVHTAMKHTSSSNCILGTGTVSGDHFAWNLTQLNDENVSAAIGGVIGNLVPRVYRRYVVPGGARYGFTATKAGLVQTTPGWQSRVIDWNTDAETPLVEASDPGGYQAYIFQNANGLMLWSGGQGNARREWARSTERGIYELVGPGVDHRIMEFATDGVNLVWVDAEDRTPSTEYNHLRSMWTSPFSPDPEVITKSKRRLRSLAGSVRLSDRIVTGCGYAADGWGSIEESSGLRVVRLSDGRQWRLPSSVNDRFGWQSVVAMTCDEVFVNFTSPGQVWNVARVRLDSLGPGEAAE